MTIGVYCIEHITSGKKYIGKSVNIEGRIAQHKYWLCKKGRNLKTTNRHLYNAVQKHGWDSFTVFILEQFTEVDEGQIAERELYWINHHNTTDRQCGYNLRLDSSTGMIVTAETRELKRQLNIGENNPNFGNRWTDDMKSRMSDIKKNQHSQGSVYGDEWRERIGDKSEKFWRDNPDVKQQMSKKVSISKRKYKFQQLDEDENLIREWDSIEEIINENPGWKWQNIYSVCNGHKKRIYGFKWRKVTR